MSVRHLPNRDNTCSLVLRMLSWLMPYAAQKYWSVRHAEWYIDRYHTDVTFKESEAKRKADWYALKSQDPAWLAAQAEKKRLQRAAKKKITKKSTKWKQNWQLSPLHSFSPGAPTKPLSLGSGDVFGFLKKILFPTRRQQETRIKLEGFLDEWPRKWSRDIQVPKHWLGMSRMNAQAEFACFLFALVEIWHRQKAEEIRTDTTIIGLTRNSVSKMAGLEFLDMSSPSRELSNALIDDRARLYMGVFIENPLHYPQEFAHVFANLCSIAHESKNISVLNCKSKGDVLDFMMNMGFFPDEISKFLLYSQFKNTFQTMTPVLFDLIKSLHEFRLRRYIDWYF